MLLHTKHASSDFSPLSLLQKTQMCLSFAFRYTIRKVAICISNVEQRTDSVTSTIAMSDSLLVKTLAKPYKDSMLSLGATQSAPLVVAEKLVL